MFDATNIIIVSDLHLGAERGRGLFRADKELASFLRWIAETARDDTLLVINGDAFDFLVSEQPTEAYRPFDPIASVRRADAIIANHGEVFESLKQLAAHKCCRLLILSGNHDPELILHSVRKQFERAISIGNNQQPITWFVHGEAVPIHVDNARVIIEHGHEYDVFNHIDYTNLRRAVSYYSRGLEVDGVYNAPLGSHLVVSHFNPLRDNYPWIDFLKPERPAIVPLLSTFLPKPQLREVIRAACLDRELPVMSSTSLVNWLKRKIAPRSLHRGSPTRASRRNKSEPAAPNDIASRLANHDRQLTLRHNALREWVTDVLHGAELRGVVTDQTKTRQLVRTLRRVSMENTYFDIDQFDGAATHIDRLSSYGANIVIHGHTHAAKAYALTQSLYMNSGTWTQLLRLPDSDANQQVWSEMVNALQNNPHSISGSLRPTYVQIDSNKNTPFVYCTLSEWRPDGAHHLSRWQFSTDLRLWTQET